MCKLSSRALDHALITRCCWQASSRHHTLLLAGITRQRHTAAPYKIFNEHFILRSLSMLALFTLLPNLNECHIKIHSAATLTQSQLLLELTETHVRNGHGLQQKAVVKHINLLHNF
ncbi:hypothetical protein STEG23_030233 [Scotinomys teguina]